MTDIPVPPEAVTQITVTLTEHEAELLSVLVEPRSGLADLEGVVAYILVLALHGIEHPRSWARQWLVQCVGGWFPERLEPDPGNPDLDRPRQVSPDA